MENYIYTLNFLNNWSSVLGQFFRIFLIVIFVALLAYYTTKLLAVSRSGNRKGSNLSLLESISVSAQSAVQIVRAGSKYLVIGVTKEKITLLTELDETQLKEPEAVKAAADMSFDKIFKRFLRKDGTEPKNRNDGESNQ